MSVSTIIESVITFTVFRVNQERSTTWDASLVRPKYIYTDTVLGERRLVIDCVYPPVNNHILRIYVYQSMESYSELATSDKLRDNNGPYQPYDLTVHTMTLPYVKFTDTYMKLQVARLIETDLYRITVVNCPQDTLIVAADGTSITDTWPPSNGGYRAAALKVGSNYYMMNGTTTSQTDHMWIMPIVPATPDVMPPLVDASALTQVDLTSDITYRMISGCVVGTDIFITGRTMPANTASLIRIDTLTNTSIEVLTVTEYSLLRTNGTVLCGLKAMSGTLEFGTINTTTLAFTPLSLSGAAIPVATTSVTGGFVKDGFTYVSSASAIYKIDNAFGIISTIGGSWYSGTGITLAGATASSAVRNLVPLQDGNIAAYCATNVFASTKHVVVFDTDGNQIGPLYTLTGSIDHSAKLMQMSDRVLVLLSGYSTATYRAVVLNLDTGLIHSYGTAGTAAQTNPSWPFRAADGRIYLPIRVSLKMPYVEGCPDMEYITAAEQARLASSEMNYF